MCNPYILCNTLQHTTTHCNTLQHTATHCNTLQHTATHCEPRLLRKEAQWRAWPLYPPAALFCIYSTAFPYCLPQSVCVWYDSSACVPWLIHVSDMTHSNCFYSTASPYCLPQSVCVCVRAMMMWRDSCTWVARLTHTVFTRICQIRTHCIYPIRIHCIYSTLHISDMTHAHCIYPTASP